MLRYPIHREIDQSMTLWGLEPDDLVVLAVIGYLVGALTSQVHLRVGPVDATLLASFGAVATAFSLWHYYRRGKPRYYLRDLLRAAAEPDIWIVTPDLHARPLIRGE
jgi:hypothetical protein